MMEKPEDKKNIEPSPQTTAKKKTSSVGETHEEIWATADEEQWSAARRRERGY
jgi:hypothetical protein